MSKFLYLVIFITHCKKSETQSEGGLPQTCSLCLSCRDGKMRTHLGYVKRTAEKSRSKTG